MNKIKSVIFALGLAFLPVTGYSIGELRVERIDPDDMKMLPAYCKTRAHTYGDNRAHPQVALWMDHFDFSDWRHMHHYCLGLLHTLYADKVMFDDGKRRTHLTRVVNEISYMQRSVSSTFILNPEMAVKKGNAYMRLGDQPNAVGEYLKALQFKKNYIPAYIKLVDINIELKDYDAAENYLSKGLEYKPDSKALKRRSAKLKKLMKK